MTCPTPLARVKVKLTGTVATNVLSQGEEAMLPEHGTLLAPGVNG